MAIIEGTNGDGTKYYQYQQPDREILWKRFCELLERLNSEIKKAALYAYWILKLKPLSVISSNIEKRTQYGYINETFALFILYGVLREKATRSNKKFSPSEEHIRKMAYAFKYWDISKEALILIAETLCEEYC